MRTSLSFTFIVSLIALGVSACSGCDDDALGGDADTIPKDGSTETSPPPPPPIEPFPKDPIIDEALPPGIDSLFDEAEAAFDDEGSLIQAPCLSAPEDGTLFPRNWLRPKVEFGAGEHDLHRIIFRADGLENELRVYTEEAAFKLPKAIWDALRIRVIDEPVTIELRSASYEDGEIVSMSETTSVSFTIAPVDAPGHIVYWAIPAGTYGAGVLRGFAIGDESSVEVLRAGDLLSPPPVPVDGEGRARCIGCHSGTPDGEFVSLSTGNVTGDVNQITHYRNTLAGVTSENRGDIPAWVNAGALAAMKDLQGVAAFSRARWNENERIALLSHEGNSIRALDLSKPIGPENPRLITASNDDGYMTTPSFSHDGEQIVYVRTHYPRGGGEGWNVGIVAGRPGHGPMDLYLIDYEGGTASPLEGAARANFNEYYPAFSPDSRLITFTGAPQDRSAYNNSDAEIFVLPAEGATEAIRLLANDPPACTGATSPGVTNSWSKWAPRVSASGGKHYYFLAFSSTRRPGGNHQLFLTAITVEDGEIQTYPALHLWNQTEDAGNHTPAWEEFLLPIVVPG